jgi:hypothetical protein
MVSKILDVVWAMPKRLTVCLVGETGIGKTPIVQQWAAEKGGHTKILNFGHMTQEEISMIMFAENGESFDFIPPGWMLKLNDIAEKQGNAILFLDEWNRGDKALVNALFTLTDERRIHDFTLHRNIMVVAAMNPSDGVYLVNEAEKDHAIRKRLNFIYCVHDLKAWLDYTKKSRWYPLVPQFIKSASNFLYDAGARDAGKTFACPSNWEKVSNIMEGAEAAGMDLTGPAVRALVEGQIGAVAATKFLDFVADQNTLIQPSEIIHKYKANSNVRKRVAALLNSKIDAQGNFVEVSKKKNRAGVINDLNQSLAIELFSTMPDTAKIAKHIAQYIGDLPNELLSTFAAQHLNEQGKARGHEGELYLAKLSTAMQGHPAYKKKMKVIITAMREYKQKAGLIKGRDPAQ